MDNNKADMIEKIELKLFYFGNILNEKQVASLVMDALRKGDPDCNVLMSPLDIAGRTVGIDEMKNFVEWVEETYARVHSEELKKSAWVNYKEETVMLHGSDYHYTTLVKEKGITTEKLIDIYFQHHLKSTV